MNHDLIYEWQIEFQLACSIYYDYIPFIRPGTYPGRDIRLVKRLGPGRIYWFWYPKRRFTQALWALIDIGYLNDPNIRIYNASIEYVSQRVGIPIEERNMPQIHLLSVEILPKK